jgi:2-iminobutanoate/2-iminopropanoate deaminase
MKTPVSTDRAPKAIGPYSQAIRANGFIFASGQIALDPDSGKVIEGGIREQTERVLQNLQAVVAAAGSSFEKAIKTVVFLADIDEFAEMNEVYGRFFPQPPPARSTVEVSRLPRGVKVEIELIAIE